MGGEDLLWKRRGEESRKAGLECLERCEMVSTQTPRKEGII